MQLSIRRTDDRISAGSAGARTGDGCAELFEDVVDREAQAPDCPKWRFETDGGVAVISDILALFCFLPT